jgi:hypothetical protein
VTRAHLTFPAGGEFKGLLVGEVPGKTVTVEDETGKSYTYSLGPGVKLWKEWLNVPPKRSPLLAGALSVLIPGIGQYYNGEENLGLAIQGVCVGALVFGGLSASSPGAKQDGVYDIAIGIFLGSYLFGIVQAPLAAMSGNETRKETLFRSASLEVLPSFTLRPGSQRVIGGLTARLGL